MKRPKKSVCKHRLRKVAIKNLIKQKRTLLNPYMEIRFVLMAIKLLTKKAKPYENLKMMMPGLMKLLWQTPLRRLPRQWQKYRVLCRKV
jgi:hypothetical protein